jgi:hypothetical protein
MKKYILAAVAAICLILSSCGDIVDSENNIHKTKLNYNSVKSDQEHGVIFPLKTGYKYFYQVTQYWSSGQISLIYNDSIVVKGEVLINGERWFQVHYPMLNNGTDIYLTNTDLGLWLKCDICNKASYLLAHYPLVNSTQPNGEFEFNTLLIDGNSLRDSCQRYINSSIENNQILNYSNSLNYQHFLKLYNNKREFLSFDCNFVENIGLIRFRQYWIDLKDSSSKPLIERLYELKKIDTSGVKVTQNTFVIDFGDVPLGFQKDTSVTLISNQTTEQIKLEYIVINDVSGVFQNVSGLHNIILEPGDKLTSTLGCSPKSFGKYEAFMQVVTDKEKFDVILKCNGTK